MVRLFKRENLKAAVGSELDRCSRRQVAQKSLLGKANLNCLPLGFGHPIVGQDATIVVDRAPERPGADRRGIGASSSALQIFGTEKVRKASDVFQRAREVKTIEVSITWLDAFFPGTLALPS